MKQDSINSREHAPPKIINGNPFQRHIMRLTLGLMRNFQISQLIYILILILQMLQTASLIICTNIFAQFNKSIILYKVYEILSYLTVQQLLYTNKDIHIGLLITSCIFLSIVLIISILIGCYGSQIYNGSQIEKIIDSIMGYIIIVFKTLLQIPILFIIIYGINNQYHNYNMVLALSILLIILLLPYFIYIFFIFGNINPFNCHRLVLSGETFYQKIFTLLSKLILVLYTAYDRQNKRQLQMLILALCYNVFLIVASHWYPYQEYNIKIKIVKQWLRYILTWFILFTIICYYSNNTQPIMFIYWIIISLCLYAVVHFINKFTCNKILYQNYIKLDNKNKIQMHILHLIYLIDQLHIRQNRIYIQGYIGYHVRLCNIPNTVCLCKDIMSNTNVDTKVMDIESKKILYFQFIAQMLKNSINRLSDTRRIYMLLTYIYQYRLNNRFQAVTWLIRLSELNGNIMQRLEYMQQMKLIQAEIKQTQSKKNIDLTIDMGRFLKFNIKIVQFQKILQKCTNNHVNFWNQLLQTHLNISKLQKCGSIIANQKQAVKEYFHNMQQLNSNNAHIMLLYGQFLKWVCNDDFQHAKLIQKAQTIFKNIKQSSKFNGKNDKYSDNSKALIIIISGNQKQVGKIVQTNNFVKQIIGYHRHQLIQQNIKRIMPKIFADEHDNSVRKFLTTSKDTYNGIQRLVTVYTQQGYIIPSLALTKPLPHLEEGIQLVGVVSQFQINHQDQIYDDKIAYILYAAQTQVIMGISKTCFTQYGIPKCLVYGDAENSMNQLKTKHLFGASIEKMEDGLRIGKQIIAKMNTKNLKDQFVITNTVSSKNIIQDIDAKIFNFNGQVILRSIFQINYHGTRLRLLSITKDILPDKMQTLQLQRSKCRQNANMIVKQQKSDSKSQTDQLKDLKDFKNFIAVKRQPMATRFLSWACIILILIFFVGVGGFIILHTQQLDMISATMSGIELAFLNRMYMTQLSFQAQKIYINYNDAYPPGEIYPQKYAIAKMKSIIQQAKIGQLNILPIKYKLNISKLNILNFIFYPNTTYGTQLKSIDESITVQLSKLYNIADGNGIYFKQYPLNTKSLVVLNYLQTKYTQVFSLAQACNQVQLDIKNEGNKINDKFRMFIIIQSSILVVLALLWLLVSLPRTLQVTQINSKVLSFFNLISADDVQQVIRKCYIFQKMYLVQAVIDQNKINHNHNADPNNDNGDANIFKKRKSQISYFNINQNESQQLSPNASFAGGQTSTMIIANANNNGDSTVRRNNELRFNHNNQTTTIDTFEQSSRDKMINKGNKQKKKVILIFGCIFLFLTAYVGTISGYLIINYNTILSQTQTMNIMYNRTAQFQQIKIMYTKYLTQATLSYSGISIDQINLQLIQRIYDTQRQLINQQTDSMYGELINQLNTKNLCDLIDNYKTYKVWGDVQLNKTECQTVQNGILTRGLKTAFVTIMEEIRSMILLPQNQKNKLNMYVVTIQAIKRYTILQKFLVRPLIMISQNIVMTKNKNQYNINLTFYLINAFLMVGLLVFWRTFWKKYIMYLNQSVWRTKSMLNLIPTKIITTNQVLMNQFTSGQLEKVVK